MKKISLFCLFMLLNLSGFTQEFPTGFWGIEFGATTGDVMRIMSQKEGVKYAGDVDNCISFEGGKWAGQTISLLFFEFYEGRMVSATVLLEPSTKRYILTLFDNIVAMLNKKYYVTKKISKEFKPPFEEGDGYETLAVESEKTFFCALWDFDYSQIGVLVLKDLKVAVTYTDTVGKGLMEKSQTDRNLSDM